MEPRRAPWDDALHPIGHVRIDEGGDVQARDAPATRGVVELATLGPRGAGWAARPSPARDDRTDMR